MQLVFLMGRKDLKSAGLIISGIRSSKWGYATDSPYDL